MNPSMREFIRANIEDTHRHIVPSDTWSLYTGSPRYARDDKEEIKGQ